MTTTPERENLDHDACVQRAVDAFAKAEASADPAAKAEYIQIAELWKETADVMRRNGLTAAPFN